MSRKVKCSTCQSVLFSCDNFKELLPIGLLSCKNCYNDGSLSDHAKQRYHLIEKAVWAELNSSFCKMKDEFQAYKKRFYKDQNKVFDALINDQTFAFTQKFVQFHEKIKAYDSRFERIIRDQVEKIKARTERQIKKLLIEQTKKMNAHLGNEQKINKQNVSQVVQCGQFVRKMISPLTIRAFRNRDVLLKTFKAEKVSECVNIFNSLTGDMNEKAEGFRKLEDLGKEMLDEQSSLPPAEPIYTQAQFAMGNQEKEQYNAPNQ